ncbi:TPA: hypothetical protein ACH3X1_004232 [Trebouxia sp. C0004]
MSTVSPTGMRVEATMPRPIVQGKVMSLPRSAQSSQPKEKAQQGEGASRLPSPMHRLAKLADQGRAQPKQPGQGGSRLAEREYLRGYMLVLCARKKAEINEPEPSGSELGTVDDLEDYSSQEKD